jgi:hypothetical protein
VAVNVTPAGPIVLCHQYESIVSNTLTSSASTLNQWYKNFSPIPGATGQTLVVANTFYNTLGSGYYTVHNRGCLSNTVYIEYKPYVDPSPREPSSYCLNRTGGLQQSDISLITGVQNSTYTWTATPGGAVINQASSKDHFATITFPSNYSSNTATIGISTMQNGCPASNSYTVNVGPSTTLQLNACYSQLPLQVNANHWTHEIEDWDFGTGATVQSTGNQYYTSTIAGLGTPDYINVSYATPGTKSGIITAYDNGPYSNCHTTPVQVIVNPNCRIMNPVYSTPVTTPFASGSGSARLVPNPATTSATFFSAGGIETIDIYNNTGMLIRRINGNGSPKLTVNTEGFPGGIYLCKITGKNLHETLKLIIQR